MRQPLTLLIVMLALLSAGLSAQRPTGNVPAISKTTVKVKLFSDGSISPSGILVVLENVSAVEISRNMTDSRGVVEFPELDLGMYRVRVQQRGFRSAMQTIDASSSPSVTAMLDLVADQPRNAAAVPPNGPRDSISANLPASDAGKKFLEKGRVGLFEKKDAKLSLGYFEQLVKSDPEYANGWILRGTALMSLNRISEAENCFRKAIALKPKDYAAQFALGVSLNAQGKFDQAIAPLSQSLTINPASTEAEYEISRSYLALNQWQAAETYTVRALESAPQFAPLHVLMGNIYLKKRNPRLAVTEFEKYLQLSPDGPFSAEVRRVRNKVRESLPANPN